MSEGEIYHGSKGFNALLREYYENATLHVTHCKDREFAHPVYNRNNQYASVEDLRNGILSQAKQPMGVYASTARYFDPHDPDLKEGWKGTDLVFDLDMDMNSDDRYTHIDYMRKLTLRLVNEFLLDLGFKLEEMVFEFSGNKGFHITIDNVDYLFLSKNQRSQICNYVKGARIDKSSIFPNGTISIYGWGRQGIHFLSELTDNPDETIDRYFPAKPASLRPSLKTLMSNPEVVERVRNGNLEDLDMKRLIAAVMKRSRDFDKEGNFLKQSSGSGNIFDSKPTTDLKRIFRIPGSIHGKSGLPSVRLDWEQMQSTDLIIDEIMSVAGTDTVSIELDEETTIDFPFPKTLSAGEHEVPRYEAMCFLRQKN